MPPAVTTNVEQACRALMNDYWTRDILGLITDSQVHGLATEFDPNLTAEGLGWMAERFITQSENRDPASIVETITAIAAKIIYGPPITAN